MGNLTEQDYNEWLVLRERSKYNKYEPGHTSYCECSDPGFTLFVESKERGTIK